MTVTDDDYPRLLRSSTSGWWRPVAGIALAALTLVAVATGVILLAYIAIALFGTTGDANQPLALDTPAGLLANNLAIAAITPAAALAVFAAHRTKVGWLASVVGYLRWRLLVVLLVVAVIVVLAFTVVGFFVPVGTTSASSSTDSTPVLGTLLGLFAVILVSTPLQAAGEEFGFRGYLSQAVSSWFARPAVGALVGALLSAALFALAHGAQQPVLFADRFVFGLVASWLAWRTGGLEASIALHAANNLVSLGYSAATGTLADSLSASSQPWPAAVVDVVMMLTFAVLADRLVRRQRLATRRVLSAATEVGYPGSRPPTSPPAGGETPWGMG